MAFYYGTLQKFCSKFRGNCENQKNLRKYYNISVGSQMFKSTIMDHLRVPADACELLKQSNFGIFLRLSAPPDLVGHSTSNMHLYKDFTTPFYPQLSICKSVIRGHPQTTLTGKGECVKEVGDHRMSTFVNKGREGSNRSLWMSPYQSRMNYESFHKCS